MVPLVELQDISKRFVKRLDFVEITGQCAGRPSPGGDGARGSTGSAYRWRAGGGRLGR